MREQRTMDTEKELPAMEEEEEVVVVAFVGDQQTGYKDSSNPETEAGSGRGQAAELVNGLWMGHMQKDMVELGLPHEEAA